MSDHAADDGKQHLHPGGGRLEMHSPRTARARLWRAMPRCIPRMLDDFDRDRAAAVEAGVGAGQDFEREEDDEQPAGQDRGAAIKAALKQKVMDDGRGEPPTTSCRSGLETTLPLRPTSVAHMEGVQGFVAQRGRLSCHPLGRRRHQLLRRPRESLPLSHHSARRDVFSPPVR